MIEEKGYVVKTDVQDISSAWVKVQRKSSCGNCTGKSTCGTPILSKIFGQRSNEIRVLNQCNAKKGDFVVIAIDDGLLLKGSFLVYFIPIILMLLFSFFATLISHKLNLQSADIDIFSIFFAFAGFLLGFLIVRLKARVEIENNNQSYQAKIISRVAP